MTSNVRGTLIEMESPAGKTTRLVTLHQVDDSAVTKHVAKYHALDYRVTLQSIGIYWETNDEPKKVVEEAPQAVPNSQRLRDGDTPIH